MRTDCVRSNRKVYLPNASYIGFNVNYAKRGFWLTFKSPFGGECYARVIGRVRADSKVYIEVVALFGAEMIPAIRWVEPKDVIACRKVPPRNVLAFVLGDWNKPADIFARVEYGIASDEMAAK